MASGLRENPCPTWPARTAGVPSALLSSLADISPFQSRVKATKPLGQPAAHSGRPAAPQNPSHALYKAARHPAGHLQRQRQQRGPAAAQQHQNQQRPAATAVVGSSRHRRSSLPSHTPATAPRSVTEFCTRPADWRQQRRQQIRRCQRQTRRVRSSSLRRPSPKLCPDATEQGVGRAERSGLGGLAGLQR